MSREKLRAEGESSKMGQIYDFKFITVVFEGDYSLLQQAVGEELRGIKDNEVFSSSDEFKFVFQSYIFLLL